jgi:transposase-like protein
MKQKILNAYGEGCEFNSIQQSFNITEDEVKQVLIKFKEKNSSKRKSTDEFKKLIAQRDSYKIPRKRIAWELGINANQVKKACQRFGQAVKHSASGNIFTVVEGVHNLDKCPNCESERVNEIESMAGNVNTTGVFCMECGSENFIMNGKVYQVNFEYMD